MAKTIQEILGYVSLTGLIQAVKTGIPDRLPDGYKRKGRQVVGDAGRYTQVRGTRQTARATMYGAAAHNRAQKGVESKDVKLIHSFESFKMDPLILQYLRNYDNYDLQNMGQQEVDRQMAEFSALFDNLDLALKYSMLALGAIYWNSDGHLLPSSSGSAYTVDYGMSANNRNQLNGIITASWANPNTDIPLQLRNLKARSLQLTGYELKHIYYGVNIPSYLTQNAYVIDYLARSPDMRQKYLDSADVPNGLFGFDWHPVYEAFYEDSSNTNQTFWSGDMVTFTPEPSQDVFENLEGSFFVPTSFNAVSDMAAALGALKMVHGKFGYAVPIHNPPTAEMYAGWTGLPIWRVPDALFCADVTP